MNHLATPQMLSRLACMLLATWWVAAAVPARAETSSTCTGYIDSVPAVVASQGVWCLRGDVSTAQTTGNAIEIAANNVTIDCNDFKIGGLAAGVVSTAVGIYAYNRKNAVIRNCNIRGFYHGILLTGGLGTQDRSAGHLVEDNRVDHSLDTGIRVSPGHGHLVRRNRILDTGGAPTSMYSSGIFAHADVIDNSISGLFTTAPTGNPRAISVFGGGHVVRGNIIEGFVTSEAGSAWGIYVAGSGNRVDGNMIQRAPTGTGYGIRSQDGYTYCSQNIVGGFATGFELCTDMGGNHAY